MSLSEVLPLLSFFESRRKKQVTTFRGPIEIGESIKINSYAYVKVGCSFVKKSLNLYVNSSKFLFKD